MQPFFQRLALLWLLPLAAAASEPAAVADLILHNARIYTLNEEQPWAASLAIAGDRILAVGDDDEVAVLAGPSTLLRDMQGRLVLPGFIDTHMHVGDSLPYVHAASLNPDMGAEEVIATLRAHARAHPEQNPVIGSGFLAAAFGELGPTAEQLDRAVPDRPAMIFDEGFHSAWINTVAMRMVGLEAGTPDPEPGVHFYRRHPDGSPTGWLIEGGAFNWISERLGVVSEASLRAGAGSFLATLSAMGITAAFDAGMIDGGETTLALFDELVATRRLPLRIVGSHYVNTRHKAASALEDLARLRARFDSEFMTVATLKLSLDGTVEARTAWMLEPYQDPPGYRARPLLDPEVAGALIQAAAAQGVDIHLHTLGDAAVRFGLDSVAAVRERFPDSTTRFTLCHIQVVNPRDEPRFGALGVVAQSTPSWYVHDDIALAFLGEERLFQHYPLRSIAAGGARVTLGSDYPASWIGLDGLNPLYNIEMALTRRPAGEPQARPQPRASEVLSLEQAIRAYTLDAAWQLRLEDQVGSLEVGKQADLVVLSDNLFDLPAHRIHAARVLMTLVDGAVVFEIEE